MSTLPRFHACPACGRLTDRSPTLFETRLLGTSCPVRKCAGCGLVYKELHPDASQLSSMYSAEYTHFNESPDFEPAEINSAKHKLGRCSRLLRRRRPEETRMLDIGCGSGRFVRIARSLGYRAEGVDPFLPEHCREPYLLRAKCEDLPEQQYHAVFLLNVAEHVVCPEALFASARRLLLPGGVMLITCPYGDSAARRLYRRRWVHLALDEHLLFWTPKSLDYMMRTLGLIAPSSVRNSGSPFPFGRTARGHRVDSNVSSSARAPASQESPGIQARLWHLAKAIQTVDSAARMVRALTHALRLGDYLEYTITVPDK